MDEDGVILASIVDHNSVDIIKSYIEMCNDMNMVEYKKDSKERVLLKVPFENKIHSDVGKLLSLVVALRIALQKDYREIYMDSNLILNWWSKGRVRKETREKMEESLSKYLDECISLRTQYEEKGGKLIKICEDDNKASF